MKQYEFFFWLIKIPLDFFIMFFAFFIARDIRKVTDLIPWISLPIQIIPDNELFSFAIFWSFLYIFIFAIHNLYSLKISSSRIKEILDVFRYSLYWFISFSAVLFFARDFIYSFDIPRLVIAFSLVIALFVSIIMRIVLYFSQKTLLSKRFLPKKKILLVASGISWKIDYVLEDIKSAWIYDVLWYISPWKSSFIDIEYLWWKAEIKAIISSREVDEIIFIDSEFAENDVREIWDYSRIFWVRYRYLTNSFEFSNTNTSLTLISSLPAVEIHFTSLDWWKRILKRLFDIASSFFLLLMLFPMFLIVAILIKIEDPYWPVFFKNVRVWQKNKLFNVYKFRYMKWKYCVKDAYWVDSKNDDALKFENELIEKNSSRKWPLYKIKNDPRKTKIWTFIEKASIDELPQLLNVFLWSMSLVWPRPHQPREVEKYDEKSKRVLTIKPWITWMAQVNWREENTFQDEVNYDIFYIENWSFLLDLKILLKTFWVVFSRFIK